MARQLLFSVTKKDLVRQTFGSPGPGGQHKNATQNCVRFIHPLSGAVGEGRVHREQYRNDRLALKSLAESEAFKNWHRAECARRMGKSVAETEEQMYARVDRMIEDGLRNGTILVEELPNGSV